MMFECFMADDGKVLLSLLFISLEYVKRTFQSLKEVRSFRFLVSWLQLSYLIWCEFFHLF